MAKKGKKLTRLQRQLLEENGINDYENWLYVKTEARDMNGEKSVGKNKEKSIFMIIENKTSGEQKQVLVK